MFSSIQQIRQEGNLPDTIEDKILESHLVKAVIEMKKIISAAKYSEIETLGADDEDYKICAIAEANLALTYALPALNTETQGTGLVRSKGYDQSRSELLSQNEIQKLADHYRGVAMDLLDPYIPQIENTEDEIADEVRGSNYRLSAL